MTTEGGSDHHPARNPARWHPARWLRRQPPQLRGLIAVLTSGGAFAVLATGLTVAGVAQRRGVWLDLAPRMFAAQQAASRAAGTDLDPSQATVEQWLTWVPTPWASAGPIAVHVLAQTLLFVTVGALVHVLGRAGRALAAAGVTLVTAIGVIVSAGPLALLPGALARATTLTSRGTTTPSLDDAAPWWWRALAAGAVLLPLGAVAVAALRGRPPSRPDGSRGRTAASTAAFLLAAEVTVLVLPGSLFPDDVTTTPAALTAVALLALGWAGADAGSREPRVRGLAVGVLLSTLGGLAWWVTWAIYRPEGPAQVVLGAQAGGGPASRHGTVPLATLAVLAPVLGWTSTAVADAVRAARRRGRPDHPDHPRRPRRPDAGPVRPRHTGTALVGLAALVAGIVAGAVVTHQRTQAADRLEAAGSAFRYSEVVALATAVPTPAGAVEQTGTACHVLGKVRCWSIRRPFADVEQELTSSLAVATGRTPSTLWRPTDVRFPGGDAVRTAVDVDGYRIEVEVMAMSTGSGRTATPTGEQSVHLSVYPVTWS